MIIISRSKMKGVFRFIEHQWCYSNKDFKDTYLDDVFQNIALEIPDLIFFCFIKKTLFF